MNVVKYLQIFRCSRITILYTSQPQIQHTNYIVNNLSYIHKQDFNASTSQTLKLNEGKKVKSPRGRFGA